jgi:hypothetical protein
MEEESLQVAKALKKNAIPGFETRQARSIPTLAPLVGEWVVGLQVPPSFISIIHALYNTLPWHLF